MLKGPSAAALKPLDTSAQTTAKASLSSVRAHIADLDVLTVDNLEYEQEICDNISSFGREKYQQFLNLSAQDKLGIRVSTILHRRGVAKIIDALAAMVGIASATGVIVRSYLSADYTASMQEAQLLFSLYLCLDYLLHIAMGGWTYMFSLLAAIDLISSVPIAAVLLRAPSISTQAYILSVIDIFCLLRLSLLQRLIAYVSEEHIRHALVAGHVLGLSAVLFAAIFQLSEMVFSHRILPFHDSIYFVVTTLSATGFGDIVGLSIVSRAVTILILFVAMFTVPWLIVRLFDVSLMQRRNDIEFSVRTTQQHVVVVLPPAFTTDEIDEFLSEFFNSNHGEKVFSVVIIAPSSTLVTISSDLRGRDFYRHLHFLSGSAHEDWDLQRSHVRSSRAVFVLSRRSCNSRAEEEDEDVHTLLAAVSIKNFCSSIPTLVQINNAHLRHNVLWKSLQQFPNVQLICVKHIKMSLLAGSSICHGLHVLVSNMLQSYCVSLDHPESWYGEYIWGASNSIFPTVFGPYFVGKTFLDAAVELYGALGVLPIAMTTRTPAGDFEAQLNPFDRVLCDGDLVYVLARDLQRATRVTRYPGQEVASRATSKVVVEALAANDDLGESFKMRKQPPPETMRSRARSVSTTLNYADHIDPPSIVSSVDFNGHIIICGYIDQSLYQFMSTLRRQALSRDTPCVLIQDAMPPHALFESLAEHFRDVYLILGDIGNTKVLDSARILDANHVLLLSNPFAKRQSDVHEQVVLVDFENIINLVALENYLHTRTRALDTNTLVEIMFLSNLRMIRPNFGYTPAAIDALSHGPAFDLRLPQLAAADGKIHASGMLQSIVAMSFFNPQITTIMDALINGTRKGESTMRIVMVRVPEDFAGRPYGDLMRALATEFDVLSVGLFRARTELRSPVPYIFTNPPSTTILCADDHVYVLAPVSDSMGTVLRIGRRMVPGSKNAPVDHNHLCPPALSVPIDENRLIASDHLQIVISIFSERRLNLASSAHSFQKALATPKLEESLESFEPDSSRGAIRRLTAWWNGRRGFDISGAAPTTHEPHDFRVFMKERTERMTSSVGMGDHRAFDPVSSTPRGSDRRSDARSRGNGPTVIVRRPSLRE